MTPSRRWRCSTASRVNLFASCSKARVADGHCPLVVSGSSAFYALSESWSKADALGSGRDSPVGRRPVGGNGNAVGSTRGGGVTWAAAVHRGRGWRGPIVQSYCKNCSCHSAKSAYTIGKRLVSPSVTGSIFGSPIPPFLSGGYRCLGGAAFYLLKSSKWATLERIKR